MPKLGNLLSRKSKEKQSTDPEGHAAAFSPSPFATTANAADNPEMTVDTSPSTELSPMQNQRQQHTRSHAAVQSESGAHSTAISATVEISASSRSIQDFFSPSPSHPQGPSCRDLKLGSISPNKADPLRDRVAPPVLLADPNDSEERIWHEWVRRLTFPAVAGETRKEVEYSAPEVILCTLKRSAEEQILAGHQRSAGSSVLQDCYLHDRDVYFISGYLSAPCLEITIRSIRNVITQLPVPLASTGLQTEQTLTFYWEEHRIFAVILQKIEFRLGIAIASLGKKFNQFLPEFNHSQNTRNEQVSQERLEVVLDDW